MKCRSTHPSGKGFALGICASGELVNNNYKKHKSRRQSPRDECFFIAIQSKGLVDNYFLAHCFYGYNKHVFSPQELYECLHSAHPQELCNSKHMDMSLTRVYMTCPIVFVCFCRERKSSLR